MVIELKLIKFDYKSDIDKEKNQSIFLEEGEIIHILTNKRPQTEKIFICNNKEIKEISKQEYKKIIKKNSFD